MQKKYQKMIIGMLEKEKNKKKKKKKRQAKWSLYLLRCADGSLYTGVTNNMERRLKMHQQGKASRYTRVRLPVSLCYQEACGTRAQALVREWKVKSLSKKKKESLAAS